MKTIILSIGGMSCSACSNGIEKYLNKQNGIFDAKVNLVMANATITYDEKILDIPKIEILDNMLETVSKLEKEDAVFILYEKVIEDTINIKDMLANIVKNNYTNIALVIGAEGGIDETEIEKFSKLRNIRIVTLGERILRAETTGPSVLSILNYELEI